MSDPTSDKTLLQAAQAVRDQLHRLNLSRVAEINRQAELSERWYPLIFSEESYEVITPGEFWLKAIFHLGQQTKDPRWQAMYEEFGAQWQDEQTMRERALGQLMAFADEQGKRLLLIVENFGALLADQISDDDAWKLRHTLQNEPRVMLLATASSRFDEIDHSGKAMYEQFRVHHLHPLDRDDCRVLWQSLTGELLEGDRVRPIQILTGGNLRLLTILSAFGDRLSLRRLMGDLVGLVDEHTEYFKSHLDALPPVERKVYLALAERWDPSTARDVAVTARLDINRTSSLLRRLVDRGAVTTLDEPGRTKWYQVSERMYNVYYLFRRRGSPAQRVRAVVRFMISFYQPDQLVTVARRIADEVPGLEPSQREDHYQVYCDLMNHLPDDSYCKELLEVARGKFADLEDVPDSLARMIHPPTVADEVVDVLARFVEITEEVVGIYHEAKGPIEKAMLHVEKGRFQEAEMECRKALEVAPDSALLWGCLGLLLHQVLSRFEEAEQAYREAVEIEPQFTRVWAQLGALLHDHLSRFQEAEEAYRKAIQVGPNQVSQILEKLDGTLRAVRSFFKKVEEACGKAVTKNQETAHDLAQFGLHLNELLSRFDALAQFFRELFEIGEEERVQVWARLAELLHDKPSRFDDAEEACRNALEIDPQNRRARRAMLSVLLRQSERREEALRFAENAVVQSPDDPLLLIVVALGLYKTGEKSCLERALAWAQQAVDLEPDDGYCQYTLAIIQCALGNLQDALNTAEKYLADENAVGQTIDEATNLLFVELAARGEAAGALRVLIDSPSCGQLEPLVVGIRIFLGEDVKVAAEIKEIGLDVAQRIEQRRDALRIGETAVP